MSLRDCLRLQRPPIYCAVHFTAFGRAVLKTLNDDLPEAMLYWVRLPCFGYHYQIYKDQHEWSQAVLCWHGHLGFKLLWIPHQIGDKPETLVK